MSVKADYKTATERSYRQLVHGRFEPTRVTVQETDLSVYAEGLGVGQIKDAAMLHRGYLEGYIKRFPEFVHTLVPWPADALAPAIVQDMIQAGRLAGVGPMAAVAGALSERVGKDLLARTDELIIENGGDIFIKTRHALTVGIFAGHSPLSLKIGLRIDPSAAPISVCTSSGSVGHSLSRGKADAVSVISNCCAVADAAATAIGNCVAHQRDIQPAIQWGRTIAGVEGILIIVGEKMGMWGRIVLQPLSS